MESRHFIVIAGNIGSGKTTLTQNLSERYGWTPHFEVHRDNPYLADFYTDMKRWSLALQMYFLSKRFQAHQAIIKSNACAIQDRSIYEDAHIFARALFESGNMDERDFENYLGVYKTMLPFLTPPDLVVYIRRSVSNLKERIKERGIGYEQNISEDYLKHLSQCYEDWIGDYHLGKVLVIEGDELDLKLNKDHFNYVCKKIEDSLVQPELFFIC